MGRQDSDTVASDANLRFQRVKNSRDGDQNAVWHAMGFISGLTSNYLQSALGTLFQAAGSTSNSTASSTGTFAASPTDTQQISPFAQLMSTLQQVQQSNPTQYQQVTQQIAANLQSAAQTAQADGNSTAASQLNQMATDFSKASQSGQMPDMQDLAQAMGGGHNHHHAHATSSDDSLNPTSIIMNTLSSAGISATNS